MKYFPLLLALVVGCERTAHQKAADARLERKLQAERDRERALQATRLIQFANGHDWVEFSDDTKHAIAKALSEAVGEHEPAHWYIQLNRLYMAAFMDADDEVLDLKIHQAASLGRDGVRSLRGDLQRIANAKEDPQEVPPTREVRSHSNDQRPLVGDDE